MPDQWASTVDHAPSKDGWATTTEHSPEPTYPTVGGKERTPEQKAFYDSAVRGKGPVDTSADFDFDAIHQGVQSLKTPGQRLHGIHQIIAGLSQGVSMPAILGGLLTNPVGTATGLATGYAGSKTASTAAKMAHLSEGAQEIAGDVGGIVGGTAGYKAPSTLSAVLENPRAAQVLTGVGQVASAPVVAVAGHTLGHTVTGGVGAAGLAARGVKNIVGGATRELTPFELANKSLKVKLAPTEYLRPEDAQYPTRGTPMAEPAPVEPPPPPPPVNNQPLRDVHGEYRTPGLAPGETAEDYFARVVKPAAAGDYLRPEDAQYPIRGIPMQEPPPPPAPPPTPVVETPRPPSGEYVTPGLQPGQTAEDYFNQVIRPKSGGGFLEGDDAELLNGLSQHYEKVNFADLDPAAQVKVRALASKGVDASHPAVKPKSVDNILGRQPQSAQPQAPTPEPASVTPIAPGTTPAELLQQEIAARRGNPTRPNVAPPSEAVPGVNVPLRPPLASPTTAGAAPTSAPVTPVVEAPAVPAPAPAVPETSPLAKNPKAAKIAADLKAEIDKNSPEVANAPVPKPNPTKAEWHTIFGDAERPFKIGEVAKWLHEQGAKSSDLAKVKDDFSFWQKAVKGSGKNLTGDVSAQTIAGIVDDVARLEKLKRTTPKKSVSDMMK